jgi:hypothetical protein
MDSKQLRIKFKRFDYFLARNIKTSLRATFRSKSQSNTYTSLLLAKADRSVAGGQSPIFVIDLAIVLAS